jgi:hypothetical protein
MYQFKIIIRVLLGIYNAIRPAGTSPAHMDQDGNLVDL